MEDKNLETGGSFASRLRGSWDEDNAARKETGNGAGTENGREAGFSGSDAWEQGNSEEMNSSEDLKESEDFGEDEEARKEEERLEKERKRAETIQKIKTFLYENKDALILGGQLAVVALVCVVGFKNDLLPEGCQKKKRKKKRK